MLIYTGFVIKHQNQKLSYSCPIFKNEKFHDANSAWKDFDTFVKKHNKILSEPKILIPKGIDFLEHKIVWDSKVVKKNINI